MMINEESKPISKTDESVSNEEECIYMRQRYNVLKAVTDKYQEELRLSKIKIQGVDTIFQLHKESRQENVNLQKRIKTLEAAVSNFQRRLSNNGLSCSHTPEETELLVPGPSEQILDNLARENLRLRRSEKKYITEVEEMKAEIEKLQSENNRLQESTTIYGQKRADPSKEKEEETTQQECPGNESNKSKQGINVENIETVSVGCQATDSGSDKLSEFKELMKSMMQRSSEIFHRSSEIIHTLEEERVVESNLKTPFLVDEDYQILEAKLAEANQMNERWLNYSQNLDGNIQNLSAQNEDLKKSHFGVQQKVDQLTSLLRLKDTELSRMSKEVTHCRSNEEIYKQQIQVCTEDFNTERKDRQQAVSKAKVLQDELTNCRAQMERLKFLNNAELISRQNVSAVHRHDFVRERGPSQPMEQLKHIGQASPLPHLSMPRQVLQGTTPLATRFPISEYYNIPYSSNIFPDSGLPHKQKDDSHSLPQQHLSDQKIRYANVPDEENDKKTSAASMPKFGYVTVSDDENNQGMNATSMPTLSRTGGLSKEPSYSVCPKCNKAFSDSSQPELMAHIDMCNA